MLYLAELGILLSFRYNSLFGNRQHHMPISWFTYFVTSYPIIMVAFS